ncbi:hypothetical protein BAE44_0014507 [Dichanthelium oligosanthes]|uniref:F-box domain-containing protein n=1 Tax=Dichanthelium oligosanthes TaxID=888268 RepID=A0A1E5VHE5_9POAL|nr:hypothetical protein BAE44_0014507 [Dichanthelium oligosanthes]
MHRSSLAALPDDDDLLWEIFLRLSPRPSSLLRAFLVYKRWCHIVFDPQFLHRFCTFHGYHHQQPPLLGFFVEDLHGFPCFTPTLGPLDYVPSVRLSLEAPRRGKTCSFLGFRHGLALILNYTHHEITLWDPVTEDQRCVAVLPGWFNNADPRLAVHNATLLYDNHHADRAPLDAFMVVLLRADDVWLTLRLIPAACASAHAKVSIVHARWHRCKMHGLRLSSRSCKRSLPGAV